ncbi:N1221-domain-containing protein [Sporormia fimetaria CBS 119925]|uniref:N1221-domain-containing protein n=1 Tax=Sporormia fimetaria CBS 119925 TaxID=1340428 RepID=A0A6A6V4R5_9PLEO|nr:N1221-domain-containing protein [Sporormia fimetaria CBS 119925]
MYEPANLDEPLFPPIVDEAELIPADVSISSIEAAVGEVDLPLYTAEREGLVYDDSSPNPPPEEGRPSNAAPLRPGLRREGSVPPAPLHLPPPAPPPAVPEPLQTADPDSLLQVHGLANTIPGAEPIAYAFKYDDASSFEEEVEEWFSYTVEERAMLLETQASFASTWPTFTEERHKRKCDWTELSPRDHEEFMKLLLGDLGHSESAVRLKSLESLVYLLLGCWNETAGLPLPLAQELTQQSESETTSTPPFPNHEKSGLQVELMRQNVKLLVECEGLPLLVQLLRDSCTKSYDASTEQSTSHERKEAERRELWAVMTAVYIVLEAARVEEKENMDLSIRAQFLALPKPGLFLLLVELVDKLRWDDTIPIPMSKLFLLAWKTILISFGGLAEVEKAKDSFKDKTLDSEDSRGKPIITASPLDYHLFRQEIISKYPAYEPPAPLFPLEPENNSILPPLKNHPNKVAGNHVFGSGVGDLTENNTSIFHKPVHIATPAPSPPPSPAGPGGKGGKKQNYQTNQMFPFMYPPLDESSNNLGGKGSTEIQDILVGRRWEGPDIPTSILEAAQLFSKRMRATRAMKQLWEERVQYMKYERGWTDAEDGPDISELSLEPKEGDVQKEPPSPGSVEERMDLVEECYRTTLPHLQSITLLMLKAVLAHVTTLVTRNTNALQSGGMMYPESNELPNGDRPHTNGVNGVHVTSEELDTLRTQEISMKAVCGLLFLLLKWFKVSHILKFEYVTQLLVDSSFVPLVLKLIQMQEPEKHVTFRCEQEELNFFHFCRAHSRNGIPEEPPRRSLDSGADSAIPPPIPMRRDDSTIESSADPDPLSTNSQHSIPEVDELGNPVSEFLAEPLKHYSWRAFYTSITVLRIMQKICKNKAHRNLMLVSYKSSQFLKKSLKVPHPLLRYYALKLFKNQVPYCGRKWRQSNMRVITAVYLHCRPELRDDWLAGSDVDADVDESMPLEKALRSLTHWFNLKRYPDAMGVQDGCLDEGRDFFARELEKMEWGEEMVSGDPDGEWEVQLNAW